MKQFIILVLLANVSVGLSATFPFNLFSIDLDGNKSYFAKKVEAINQSSILRYVGTAFSHKGRSACDEMSDLSPENLELCKELHKESGLTIPCEYKQFDDKGHEHGGFNMGGLICLSKSFLTSARFDGTVKHAVRHELTHFKYNDSVAGLAIFPAIIMGYCAPIVATYFGCDDVEFKHRVVSSALAAGVANILLKKIGYYFERRADIEALYASKCSECAFETAEESNDDEELLSDGYLNKSDILYIANKLKDANLLCSSHRQVGHSGPE